MPVATGIALGLGAASAVSGAVGAHFAGKAQANAGKQALTVEEQKAKDAHDFQTGVWDQTQKNQQPYLDLGSSSANHLKDFLANPFKAPTLEEAKANPGYQFALDTGTQALDRSASARGNLFSGTQGTALQEFGQKLGEQNYDDVYSRAMNDYMTRFNTLFSTTQLGENATANTANEGQAAAGNIANIDLTSADQEGRTLQGIGAARASGYVGMSNAISGGLSYGANVFQDMPYLSQIKNSQLPIPGAPDSWMLEPHA